MRSCTSCVNCSRGQGEEKQLSEKSLHHPASPAMLPDHLKCNILKAQMEAAFRVSAKVDFHLIIKTSCKFNYLDSFLLPISRRKFQQHLEGGTPVRPSLTGQYLSFVQMLKCISVLLHDLLSTPWLWSSGIKARPKTLLHPVWLQTKHPIGKTSTLHQRGCSQRSPQAATAENDWSDSSACEYTWPPSTWASVSGKLHS